MVNRTLAWSLSTGVALAGHGTQDSVLHPSSLRFLLCAGQSADEHGLEPDCLASNSATLGCLPVGKSCKVANCASVSLSVKWG